MADKQAPFSEIDEEEFHITDDDLDHELEGLDEESIVIEDPVVGDLEGSPARKEKKQAGFLKALLADRKRLVIVLIIVFAMAYAISKLFSAKHQNIDNIQPVSHPAPTTVREPREKMLANVQTTVDATAKAAPTPVTTNTENTVMPALTALPISLPTSSPAPSPVMSSPVPQTENSALTRQLQTLQNDNQALSNKLAEVSAQLVQVSSAMNNLNNKVDNMAKQPLAAPTVSVAKSLPKLVTDQHYYVEAVVPGRAWIQTASGETITVTVGEDIKGLGNVVSIEPATGEVVTTSGEIIKYGPY